MYLNRANHALPRHAAKVRTALVSFVPVLPLYLGLILAQTSIAQPKAIGPEDISRLHQETEFSGDWSKTDAFDLDQYVTLQVTLEGIEMPERAGNAVLWFSTSEPSKLTSQRDIPRDYRMKATLQSAQVVRYLDLSERQLPRGAEAVLRGWLATDRNSTGSVLLVDDIRLAATDETFSLHADNLDMASKRETKSRPD